MFTGAVLVTFLLTGCVDEKIENAELLKTSTNEKRIQLFNSR